MGSTGQQAGRLVDYFAVCGLDPSIGLQSPELSGKLTQQHKTLILSDTHSQIVQCTVYIQHTIALFWLEIWNLYL